MEKAQGMSATRILATVPTTAVSRDAEKIRERCRALLTKANKEHPRASDVKALKELLDGNKELKLWTAVMGMGELAENQALDTITDDRNSGHGSRECWKQRLQSMRADMGHDTSSPLERLLIQQVTLCWLNLSLLEYRHVNIMKQSITLTLGAYWDQRLTMAQRRFTRACESLARVRRLSHRMPIQVNIAAQGGQQINLASEKKGEAPK
jgi:hypothetical protein